jgi:hypothetical protein
MVEPYLHSLTRLHGVALKYLSTGKHLPSFFYLNKLASRYTPKRLYKAASPMSICFQTSSYFWHARFNSPKRTRCSTGVFIVLQNHYQFAGAKNTCPVYVSGQGPGCRNHNSHYWTDVDGLDDRGIGVRIPVGTRIFYSLCGPDRRWGPLNLLYNGYRGFFPEGKATGAWS